MTAILITEHNIRRYLFGYGIHMLEFVHSLLSSLKYFKIIRDLSGLSLRKLLSANATLWEPYEEKQVIKSGDKCEFWIFGIHAFSHYLATVSTRNAVYAVIRLYARMISYRIVPWNHGQQNSLERVISYKRNAKGNILEHKHAILQACYKS